MSTSKLAENDPFIFDRGKAPESPATVNLIRDIDNNNYDIKDTINHHWVKMHG
jgi:hypothetical protein